MRRSTAGLALPAFAALALAGAGLATPPAHGNRHRAVAGWIVEDEAEEDGGRVVELRRETGGIHIRYTSVFWHGNDGRIQSALVERSDCTNGEEIGRHVVPEARALRAIFAQALADCAVPPRRVAALLAGFEPAYALTLAWSHAAAAATAAEAAAIAAYGDDGANSVEPQPHP
jgi:hypothetical protein